LAQNTAQVCRRGVANMQSFAGHPVHNHIDFRPEDNGGLTLARNKAKTTQ
jgi:hypothetical protein